MVRVGMEGQALWLNQALCQRLQMVGTAAKGFREKPRSWISQGYLQVMSSKLQLVLVEVVEMVVRDSDPVKMVLGE